MTSSSRQKLSPGELDIMCEIWRLGTASVNDIQDAYNKKNDKEVSRNTILVQLQRIENKGWLSHRKEGRVFLYEPAITYKKAAAELTRDFRKKMFDGSTTALVRCLFEGRALQPEEVDELQSMIDQMATTKKGPLKKLEK